MQYVPGTGFYFNSLIHNGAAITNANGGCDLQNVRMLGTADISAVARYPYKPVDFPSMTSNTVHKDVKSLWSKTLATVPEGCRRGEQQRPDRRGARAGHRRYGRSRARPCASSPERGERLTWFNGTVDGRQPGWHDADARSQGGNRLCIKTDPNGNAAIEVFESNPVNGRRDRRLRQRGHPPRYDRRTSGQLDRPSAAATAGGPCRTRHPTRRRRQPTCAGSWTRRRWWWIHDPQVDSPRSPRRTCTGRCTVVATSRSRCPRRARR